LVVFLTPVVFAGAALRVGLAAFVFGAFAGALAALRRAFASRDFLRAALFEWMMPLEAALSNAPSTVIASSESAEAAAFL